MVLAWPEQLLIFTEYAGVQVLAGGKGLADFLPVEAGVFGWIGESLRNTGLMELCPGHLPRLAVLLFFGLAFGRRRGR
jgi:hypothetical protein